MSADLTVYNFIHIGNARPMIVFDTVRRYFEYKGYDVNFVSNFTDVDDKIIKKANEEGVTAEEISKRYIEECKKRYGRDECQACHQKIRWQQKKSAAMIDNDPDADRQGLCL